MIEVQKGNVQNMEDLLSSITYIKELLKSVNGKKDIDSNVYYELVLGKLKLGKLKDEDGVDTALAEECNGLIQGIDIILGNFTDTEVSDILSRDTKSIDKLDKVKYYSENKTLFGKKLKRMYKKVDGYSDSVVKDYIRAKAGQFIIVFIIMIFICLTRLFSPSTGGSSSEVSFADSIVDILFDDTTTENSSKNEDKKESKDTSTEKLESINTSEKLEPVNTSVKSRMKLMLNVMKFLFNFVGILLLCVTGIIITIDIVYLSIPAFRSILEETGKKDSFVSSVALSLADNEFNMDKCVYKPIKNKNRIKRNLDLLNYLLERNPNNKELLNLNSSLDSNSDSKLYYTKIARVEYVVDNLFVKGELVLD